jgi:hypothetical protein
MPQITDAQMEDLKRYISASPDACEDTKRILIWMLDQTENFSVPVLLTFPPEFESIGKKAVNDVHWMVSQTMKTRINDFLKGLGMEFPSGTIHSRSNKFGGGWHGWIYIGDGERKSLVFNHDEVQKIVLPS